MKKVILSVIVLFSFSFVSFAQSKTYWSDAPNNGTKIYSIQFIDSQNGFAKSKLGELLKSTDGGITWKLDSNNILAAATSKTEWFADIYCSIMFTTDGGTNWLPYNDKDQDHFCQVYFKNDNTGW